MTSQTLDPYRSITTSRMMYHKLHHRMSWVSLYMKSPYNALWFVLAGHVYSFNYLCLSLSVPKKPKHRRLQGDWSLKI